MTQNEMIDQFKKQLEEVVDVIVDDTETLTVEEEAKLDKDVK